MFDRIINNIAAAAEQAAVQDYAEMQRLLGI